MGRYTQLRCLSEGYLTGLHSPLECPCRGASTFSPTGSHEKKHAVILVSNVVSWCCLAFCPRYYAANEAKFAETKSGGRWAVRPDLHRSCSPAAQPALCSWQRAVCSSPGMWALQELLEVMKHLRGDVLKVPKEWLRCWQLCYFEREICALHSRGMLKCLSDAWLCVGACFASDLWDSGNNYWRAFDKWSCMCTYQLQDPAACP